MFAGTGPCDIFDSRGRKQRAQMRYQQQVIDNYQRRLRTACRSVPNCHDDQGALARMRITAADLTPDLNHLSTAGQQKQAATEWEVIAPAPLGVSPPLTGAPDEPARAWRRAERCLVQRRVG